MLLLGQCVKTEYLIAVFMVLKASIIMHETVQFLKAFVLLFCLKCHTRVNLYYVFVRITKRKVYCTYFYSHLLGLLF